MSTEEQVVTVEVDVTAEDELPESGQATEAAQEGGETAAPPAPEQEQEPAGQGDGESGDSDEEQPAEPQAKEDIVEEPVATTEQEAEPVAAAAVEGEGEGKVEGEGETSGEGNVESGGEGESGVERPASPLPGVPIHIGAYLQMMLAGSDLVKVRKSKVYPRIYKLEGDLLGITWNSRSKKGNKARIAVKQIQEVRQGRSTDTFKVATNAASYAEEKCFSVVYLEGGKHRSLDLVALSRSDAEAWVAGLGTLVREMDTSAQRSRVRERWLRDLFEDADQNGDGTLDLKEVIAMLRRLNVGVSKKVIKQKFKEADTEGSDQKLDFEEFCGLFKELATRPEVNRLFHLYSSKSEWLTAEDLQRFLQLEQGVEDASVEYCSQLIGQYEATEQGKAEGLLSIDGFTQFLMGPENDLFNKSHREVYQDMTQPLSHYHIASSHNTYLLEDQLRGPSSVEAYIRALQKGCRCVELDCWDGEDGEPVIYHGHTLTSKILFRDVIVAIKEHSFTASPYPVILSIENHCSIPQQSKMAEYFEEILGDMLCNERVDEGKGTLPSPESLKGKILIKGKKLKPEQEDADDGEVSDEDEAAEVDTSRLEQEKKATKTAGAVANGTSTEGVASDPVANGTSTEGVASDPVANGTSTEGVASDPVANGTTTEGEPEGKKEGEPEGKKEGEPEGKKEGEPEGKKEGEPEGKKEGEPEGKKEGEPEGKKEGEPEGKKEGEPEGKKEGEPEGKKEGEPEGKKEGEPEGKKEGEPEGKKEGEPEGKKEGEPEGKKEGEPEGKKEGEPEGKKEGEGEAAAAVEGGSTEASAEKKSEAATLPSPGGSAPKRSFSFKKKRPVAVPDKKKVKLSTRLSKCINYVQSVHFKGFDDWGEAGKYFQMSSFGESSAVKYSSRNQCSGFMLYNKKQLSRIYPSGRRVDSSNYNPVDMWNSGCQIVALNYQTQDLSMDLNDGKFQQNGRSGYIVKPRVQREETSRFDFHGKVMPGLTPRLYTITVISAQTLPKPPGGSKTGEVIDPYIVINIYGRHDDQHQFQTKTIQDNGFNPVWNQTFSFVVQAPDYTYIRFKVMDKDWGPNVDDFIGQFSAPLESIMPGYRHIHLNCSGSPLENASLFIHIDIMDYIGTTSRVGRGTFKTKKSREYPASFSVNFPAIDAIFQASQPHLRRAVDMNEDYMYAILAFKESCGHGAQALLSDCVQLMAARAKAADVAIFLDVVGESEAKQVYRVGYPDDATPPQTLVTMMTAFNMLNTGILALVVEGDALAAKLEKAYGDSCGHRGELKAHLLEMGANSRKINQTMEHFGYVTCTLTLLAQRLRDHRKVAEADLKKIVAAAQKYDIEMKTSM